MLENAVDDYDMAIELYPDFAKAYMNRSYVKNLLGDMKSSKKDYDTAQRKVKEYREKNITNAGSFADTTKKYSSLLSLDAEFAKKDFNDELLQNRDINVRLRPLYKFALTDKRDDTNYALARGYENPLLVKFLTELPVPVVIGNEAMAVDEAVLSRAEAVAIAEIYWEGFDIEEPAYTIHIENDPWEREYVVRLKHYVAGTYSIVDTLWIDKITGEVYIPPVGK